MGKLIQQFTEYLGMTQREGGSNLLYVDPDPAYRRKILSAFEPEWVVTTAESADEATAAMDGSFDCVVAADELPEMGGLAFFDSLESETDETPFVLFTAEEDTDLLRQAFRAGVSDVIYKQRSPDISDGIVGLKHSLDTLDIGSTDLNG